MCIDARLVSGTAGGVETVVIGLAQGLRALEDPELQLTFLNYTGHEDWLRPHLDPRWSVVTSEAPGGRRWPKWSRRALGVVRPLHQMIKAKRLAGSDSLKTPLSDGVAERTGAQVLHFPHQEGSISSLPTIYQPHDLQHQHLPAFFSDVELARRKRLYQDMCDHARVVVVGTSWVKDDIVRHLSLPPEKVQVIALAPLRVERSMTNAQEVPPVLKRLQLTSAFALYPASMWLHKNHVRLLDALAVLRDQGLVIPMVFTGAANGREPEILLQIAARQLDSQVIMAGFLPEHDLDGLYSTARMVVVPTLFESASFPVWEAFLHGVPVACSHVTSLPRQVADAALLFDPLDPMAIATAMESVWTDEPLRAHLKERGAARVAEFTWPRTAENFRAVYRRAAGETLSAADQALLNCKPPM